ncbi:VWA domain-containing protein [Virgibacillus sp. NKC19-3]|uniref:vWA domain-containing protein n=1 Tax=Virgibacillus saliphilus TaxID=2831674 RepID=UPI001C9AFEB4|nr:VWA domain-containing protein [Virgibacillus sp. NKC19-3]MBY7142099.1 VWA domain-containing protein [Virgibacillus sp. NKC19-3]
MFKRGLCICFVMVALFLVGCNDEQDVSSSDEPNKDDEQEESVSEVEAEESTLERFEDIGEIESREDMKAQEEGTLVADMTLEEELEDDSSDKELDPSIVQALEEELEHITSQTQDPEEINKALVHLLGTPHYNEVIEKAEEFEPDFEEPFLPDPGKSEKELENEPAKGKAIILLDASSSMLLRVDNEVKMDIAKDAVERFGETIGQDNDVSLVVYGHKGSESEADKELSCNGIEEIYPMDAYDESEFTDALSSFESKGYTPLAGAIQKAADMSSDYEEPTTVYIVSDGVETCDGDPVEEAANFVKDSEDTSVNIIGFNVDEDAQEQLKEVSDAGAGEYFSADNADELKTTIEQKWLPSRIDLAWAFTKAPDGWETLAEKERFDEGLNPIKDVIDSEASRYSQALQILNDEQLVDSEVSEEVRELREERHRKMYDVISAFSSEKKDEIDARADDIHQEVDEWTEEMRKQKEENDDLF